jgi:hypothetical protein
LGTALATHDRAWREHFNAARSWLDRLPSEAPRGTSQAALQAMYEAHDAQFRRTVEYEAFLFLVVQFTHPAFS